jgi:glycosyltransferase involved in cell wall biosynthesis
LKVAIVHDWLNQYGGAEQVLSVLHGMYPSAPIYTSIYDPNAMPETYRQWDIRTSFMQHLPLVRKHHRPFLPLYPLAFETFDLSEFDLVISNSSGFCHGVLTQPHTCHINYCLTPPRFVWNLPQYLEQERVNVAARRVLPWVNSYLRAWDLAASYRVDYFIAISEAVGARIRKFYRRRAALIYPPVDTRRFELSSEIEDYFLVVSRLVPYKRVDIAVEAFSRLGLPLVIAGDGRDRKRLEAMAKPNVRFLGRIAEEELPKMLARCRAFIFPGEEDFGIAPLEAQAAGRPVIAYAAGGALETVVERVTGCFFHEQEAEALAEAVRHFDERDYDPTAIRHHALGFDIEVFKEQFRAFVAEKITEYYSKSTATYPPTE